MKYVSSKIDSAIFIFHKTLILRQNKNSSYTAVMVHTIIVAHLLTSQTTCTVPKLFYDYNLCVYLLKINSLFNHLCSRGILTCKGDIRFLDNHVSERKKTVILLQDQLLI